MTLNAIDEATISLVIPSYNRAQLIGETIDAALCQTRPFAEILVIDDGSTDNSLDELEKFAGRIRVMSTANQGVQAARNAGAMAARGRYLAFCDSDDILEPGFAQTFALALEAVPQLDIFYCNFVEFGPLADRRDRFSLAPPGYFDGACDSAGLLTDIPDLYLRSAMFQTLYASGMTVRKAFFDRLGGFDPAFRGVGSEDWEFTLRAISQGRHVVCRRALARVRKHPANQSRDSLRQFSGEARVLEHGLRHHPGAGKYRDAIEDAIQNRRLHSFNLAFARGNFPLARELARGLPRVPHGFNFRLKYMIASLPGFFRTPLWRLSQQKFVRSDRHNREAA